MYTININKLPIKYWDINTILSYIQRIILLHSICYYMLDNSKISDKDYDNITKLYINLVNKYNNTTDITKTDYYYVFYDFDGSTGFDLYYRLNKKDKTYLTNIASNMVRRYN